MPKSIIAEGKTTNEAISNGLKQLNVSKENVDIKVLENSEKRSFFSILAPRVVKVELTLREESEKRHKILEKKIEANQKDIDSATENVERFRISMKTLLFNSLSAAGSVLVPWSNVYCLDVNFVRIASANLS